MLDSRELEFQLDKKPSISPPFKTRRANQQGLRQTDKFYQKWIKMLLKIRGSKILFLIKIKKIFPTKN